MADDAIPGVDMDAAIAQALEGLGDESLAFDTGGDLPDDTGQEPAAGERPEAAGGSAPPQEGDGSPPEPETPSPEEDSLFALPEEPAEPAQPEHPFGDSFRWEELPDDPAVRKLAKGLQGSYSRKMAELAEQRRQAAPLLEYLELERAHPQAAAQLLAERLKALGGLPGALTKAPGAAPQPLPDPLAGFEAETTNEQALADVARGLYQQLYAFQQQQQQLYSQQQQAELARQQQEIDRQIQSEIKGIEALVKRPLSPAEVDRIAAYANENRIGRLDHAFKLMYQEQALAKAQQKGREEAMKDLGRKSLAAALPQGAPPRERSEPAPTGKSEVIEAAMRQFGLLR